MKSLNNYITESNIAAQNVYNPSIGSILYVVNGFKNKNGKCIPVKVKSVSKTTYGENDYNSIEFENEVFGISGYTIQYFSNSEISKITPEIYKHIYNHHDPKGMIQIGTSKEKLEEFNNDIDNEQIKQIDDEIQKLNQEISNLQNKVNNKNEEKRKIIDKLIKY